VTTTVNRARLRAIAVVVAAIAATSGGAVAAPASGAAARASGVAAQAGSEAATGAAHAPAARQLPRSTTQDSLHWVGYTFPVRHVTGVRADWTEPTVHGKKGTEEFVWIGIGGWNQSVNNIIQAGTFAYFPPGGGPRHEGVWYERVPQNPEAQFPLVAVDPGDHVQASIMLQPGRRNRWRMSVTDTTLGTHFGLTVRFTSQQTFPSFVVEDPNKGSAGPNGPFYPFPRWKSVTFSHVEVRIRSTWRLVARLASAYRVDMVRNGRTLATARSISRRSGFTATQR
jgi:Peptidase A4 family